MLAEVKLRIQAGTTREVDVVSQVIGRSCNVPIIGWVRSGGEYIEPAVWSAGTRKLQSPALTEGPGIDYGIS
jgi:hypothetical protein